MPTIKLPKQLASYIDNSLSFEYKSILLREESRFKLKPNIIDLFSSDEEKKEYLRKVREITAIMHGVPILIIKGQNEPKKKYDTYIHSIINELVLAFDKMHKALIRQKIIYNNLNVITKYRDILKKVPPDEVISLINEEYWDQLEILYFRIAAFWDRAGQLLDYVYFNIRKYDQETFSAVIDKIGTNYSEIIEELKSNKSYKNIIEYARSEKIDGLKMLFQRRNAITHSVGFSYEDKTRFDFELYDTLYNHFEEKRQKKLNKRGFAIEFDVIFQHYEKARTIFPDIIEFSLFGAKNSMNNRKN